MGCERTFVNVIFVAVVGVCVCTCHARVAAHICIGGSIGHAAGVGVHVWIGRALVSAVVLFVHKAGGLLAEFIEIHDDGYVDRRCDFCLVD
jgi:hypothetical protein